MDHPVPSRHSHNLKRKFASMYVFYDARNVNLEKLLAHDNCITEIPIDVARLKTMKVSPSESCPLIA